MSNFAEYRLEELCEKITDGSHQSPKAFDGGKPMFSVKDMNEFGFSKDNVKKISEADYINLVGQGCKPEVNDVLIAKDGSVMKHVFKVEENIEGVLLSSIAIVRPNTDLIEPDFLVYSLLNPVVRENILNNYVSGSGVPRIVLKDFKKIILKIPSLDKQRTVSNVLKTLDKRINLNRQTNQTLEHIAQAIFKSWFVDFEPTRAKIIVKGKGENAAIQELAAQAIICGALTLEQLQDSEQDLEATLQQAIKQKLTRTNGSPITSEKLKTTAALFPNKLVESDLGLIPVKWSVSNIDNATSLIVDHRGKTPNKLGGEWAEEGYPAISAKNVKSGRLINLNMVRYVSDDLYKKWMKNELMKGDILLTSEGPLGEMYFITDDSKYCLSQRLYALRANLNVTSPTYLYLWMNSNLAKAEIESRATGTTVVGIRQSELRKSKVLLPCRPLVEAFEAMAFPLLQKIGSSEKESQILSSLRDTLLPILLSGKL